MENQDLTIKCDKCGAEMDPEKLETVGVVEHGWAFCPSHSHGEQD